MPDFPLDPNLVDPTLNPGNLSDPTLEPQATPDPLVTPDTSPADPSDSSPLAPPPSPADGEDPTLPELTPGEVQPGADQQGEQKPDGEPGVTEGPAAEKDDGNALGDFVDDLKNLPVRVAKGIAKDFYGFLDFLSGDRLEDWDPTIGDHAKTILGGFLTGLAEFSIIWLPVGAGIGKLSSSVAKLLPKNLARIADISPRAASALARRARLVEAAGGKSLGLKIAGAAKTTARVESASVLTSWYQYQQGEALLSNLLAKSDSPAFNNAVTQYLSIKDDDTEAEGRFKAALEDSILGQVFNAAIFTTVRALKTVRKIRKRGGSLREAAEALEAQRPDIEQAMLNPSGRDTTKPQAAEPLTIPDGDPHPGTAPISDLQVDEVDALDSILLDPSPPSPRQEAGAAITEEEAFRTTTEARDLLGPKMRGAIDDIATEEANLETLRGDLPNASGPERELILEQISDGEVRLSSMKAALPRVQADSAEALAELSGERVRLPRFSSTTPKKPTRTTGKLIRKIQSVLSDSKLKSGEETIYEGAETIINTPMSQTLRKAASKDRPSFRKYVEKTIRTIREAVLSGEFSTQNHGFRLANDLLEAAPPEYREAVTTLRNIERRRLIASDDRLPGIIRRIGTDPRPSDLIEQGFNKTDAERIGQAFAELDNDSIYFITRTISSEDGNLTRNYLTIPEDFSTSAQEVLPDLSGSPRSQFGRFPKEGDKLFHVTLNKKEIEEAGLLSQKQLQAAGKDRVGLGGSEGSTLISVTWNEEHAGRILRRLQQSVTQAQNPNTEELINFWMKELGVDNKDMAAIIRDITGPVRGEGGGIAKFDDPVLQLSAWLNDRADPEKNLLYDFHVTLDEHLGEIDPSITIKDETSVILLAPAEKMAKVDPDNIGILQVAARKNVRSRSDFEPGLFDPTEKSGTTNFPEFELRLKPDDVQVLLQNGPIKDMRIRQIYDHLRETLQVTTDGLVQRYGRSAVKPLVEGDGLRQTTRVATEASLQHKVASLRFVTPELENVVNILGLDQEQIGKLGFILRQNPDQDPAAFAMAMDSFIDNAPLNMRQFIGGDDGPIIFLRALERLMGTQRSRQLVTDDMLDGIKMFLDRIDPSDQRAATLQLFGVPELEVGQKIFRVRFFAAQAALRKFSIEGKKMFDDLVSSPGLGFAPEKKNEFVALLKAMGTLRDYVSRYRSEAGKSLDATSRAVEIPPPPSDLPMIAGKIPLSKEPLPAFPSTKRLSKEGPFIPELERLKKASPTEEKEGFKPVFNEPRTSTARTLTDKMEELAGLRDIIDKAAIPDSEITDFEFKEIIDRLKPLFAASDEQKTLLDAARVISAPDGLRKWIGAFWFNALLSGLKTNVVNTLGTFGHLVIRPMQMMLGAAATGESASASLRRGMNEFTSIMGEMRNIFKYFKTAWVDGPKLDPGRSTIEGFTRQGVVSVGDFAKRYAENPGKAILDSLFGLVNTPSRFLQSTDEAFQQVAYRSNFRADVAERLMEQSSAITPRQAWEEAARVLDDNVRGQQAYSARQLFQRGRELAIEQGTPPAFVNQVAKDYVAQNIDKTLLQVSQRSLQVSKNVAFQTPLAAGSLASGLSNLTNHHWIAKMIVPFVRTPTNLLYTTMRHFDIFSPMKLFTTTKVFGKDRTEFLKTINNRHSLYLQDMASGDPARAAEAIGRVMMGYMAMVSIFVGVAQGVITGSGPADPRKRRAWMETGWRPNSFKVGDAYFSYERVDPFAGIVGISADLAEHLQRDPDPTDPDYNNALTGVFTGIATAVAHNLSDKTYTQNIANAMEFAFDPTSEKSRKFAGRLAGTIVPTLASDIARSQDPFERELRDLTDFIRVRIPWARTGLPLQRNFLGEPRDRAQSAGHAILGTNDPVSTIIGTSVPIQYSAVSDSLLDKEIGQLGYGFTPPPTTKNGIDLVRTDTDDGRQAYDRWLELHGTVEIDGQTLRQALTELIKSPEYQALTPESTPDLASPRVRLLSRLIRRYRLVAWTTLLQEAPSLRAAVVEQARRKTGLLLGVPINDL